jgi:hypothetical protein
MLEEVACEKSPCQQHVLIDFGLFLWPVACETSLCCYLCLQVALLGSESLSWGFSTWIQRHMMVPLHPFVSWNVMALI